MKHAYLILAHNDFELLQELISALDDPRFDIYIHIDKKVEELPQLTTTHSRLTLIDERIDVRWASVRMLEAEFALFRAATAGGAYNYYHLISGADLPLKSPSEIDAFFEANNGREFIGFSQYDYTREVEIKVNRYHLFSDHFKGNGILFLFRRVVRALYIRLQSLFHWQRHKGVVFKKGTQWVSITHSLVTFLLSKEAESLRMYRGTFCSDEIMVQTWAWGEPRFRVMLYNTYDEAKGCLRYINWHGNKLPNFTMADLPRLQATSALWARKFSSAEQELVKYIVAKKGAVTEDEEEEEQDEDFLSQ